MADPLLFPDNQAAKIRQLEERMRALETANRLLSSSILGGSLRILDAAGARVALLGNLSPGVDGVRVYTNGGNVSIFEVNQVDGFSSPWYSTAWRLYSANVNVTIGTFAPIYETLTELLFSSQVLFRVPVNVAVGTTGEMRVVVGGVQLGSVKTLPSGASASYEFRMTHGITMGGGPILFQLEVRRTSGAGNVTVFEPAPLHYGGNMSTVAGGWV